MIEFLKAMFLSRLTQLASRYIGGGLLFVAGKVGANVPTDQITGTSDVLGLIAASAVFFLADLVIHTVRGKTEDATASSKKFPPPVILVLSGLLLFAPGCGKRPPEVTEASKLRKQAYLAANESKNAIIATIVEVYREAEYRRIDLEIDRAIEEDFAKVRANATAFNNQVPVETAIAGTKRLIATREAERTAARKLVDERLKDIDAIVAQADTNILIANRLHDAVEEYENVGIDVSAAGKAVEEILALVGKQSKPKPQK